MLVGEGRNVLKILIDKIKKRLKRKYKFIQNTRNGWPVITVPLSECM